MFRVFIFLAEFISDIIERKPVLRRFNESAKASFYKGDADVLAKARTTVGNSAFSHPMSRIRSGFNVQLLGIQLIPKSEATKIAQSLLSNSPLMRQLMAIGYDTLEIETGGLIYNWSIKQYHNQQDFQLPE